MGNEYGILNARRARVNGHETLVTHRNPANGDYWCNDILKGWNDPTTGKYYIQAGCWIPSEAVSFI